MPANRAADGWSVWPAPAKLNLFLHIVGRRADGYHRLQSVFQLLDWGDEIALRSTADGRIERLEGPPEVSPESDLSVRAARALQQAAGTSQGAQIAVRKQIPQGGGFGGGSSDAATVLLALDRLWGTGLSIDELAAIGLKLGADVPVFVRGHSAWAEGVGEELTPIELGARCYLLVDPGVHVPTAELFQAPDLTRDAPSATISDFVSGKLHGNVFEPVLRRRVPAVDAAMTWLERYGRAQLTGTGGGLFVAFDRPEPAQAALDALPQGWRAWLAKGVDRSPLHAALAAEAGARSG